MKITNQAVIQSGERELIDAITADLDWEAVEALFVEQHRLPLGEDVSFKNGDIVVNEDRIAYLLEFEVKVPLSMLLDRNGSCIRIRSASDADSEGNVQDPEPETATLPCVEQGDAGAAETVEENRDGDEIRERVSDARTELIEMSVRSGA